jgi:hypothetical protein
MNSEEKEMDKGKETEQSKESQDEVQDREMPPASFYSVVSTFQIPAMHFLGELRYPDSKETTINPSMAKYYIDCLAILDEKMKGNLEEDEGKFLDNVLAQLRLSFVKVSSGKEGGGA